MRPGSRRHATSLKGSVLVAALATALWLGVLTGPTAAGRLLEQQIRLTVQLTGSPPKQQSGGLSGQPGTTPGGPSGPTPARRGVFTMSGALHDHGTAVFRLPPLGSPNRKSTIELHGSRGFLRLRLAGGGGGSTTAGSRGHAHWHVVAGSGLFVGAKGGGATVMQTPQTIALSGELSLRNRG